MKIENIETPALLVSADALERNINKMALMLKGKNPRLRPHYKTHKCPYISAMQIKAGAKGITCSKLSEAEDLADSGIEDILIANQIVGESKLSRLAELAKRCHLTVCADCEENIRDLSAAASSHGAVINCYVELELGMKRCGVDTYEEFYELAKLIKELPGLEYLGVQAYSGNMAHEFDREKRMAVTDLNEKRVEGLVAYLRERGIDSKEVSGGSTGTSAFKAESRVYTELQAGSYIFMDNTYGQMDLGFENALFVLATVISTKPGRFVIDAGVKSLCPDQGPPRVLGYDAESLSLSEEHTSFYCAHDLSVGDKVLVIPGHCCSTVNLYDEIYFEKDAKVIARLPVVSRGKSI